MKESLPQSQKLLRVFSMEEPNRIGLSSTATAQIDDLLEDLNSDKGEVELLKRDLYRLAVALGVKNHVLPPPLEDKSGWKDRVGEFDPEGVLYVAVETAGLVEEGRSIYEFIECLAEYGIKNFYLAYQKTGQLPIEDYFEE